MFSILFLKFLIVVVVVLHTSLANQECLPSYGMNIDMADYTEAIKTFTATVPVAGGWRSLQRFSRNSNAVGKSHHMPQPFVWRTCAIGIDVTDPPHGSPVLAKISTWEVLSLEVAKLLHDCVL